MHLRPWLYASGIGFVFLAAWTQSTVIVFIGLALLVIGSLGKYLWGETGGMFDDDADGPDQG